MQKDVKKMEFYSEQIRFMCKYKLETTDAVDELKTKKLREKQIILNKRNRLYYHRNKCNNEEDEDAITKDIIIVTDNNGFCSYTCALCQQADIAR